MLSPVLKVSFLLSSKTEFKFSTQTGSIGPSNTIQFLLSEVSYEHCLIAWAIIPSDQSWLIGSNEPIS